MSGDRKGVQHGREIALPKRSRLLISLFGYYTRRYIRRHFHAVRLDYANRGSLAVDGPLIIYVNHPSWWDPLICLLVARHCFPERKHYAPIDLAELERYRFFSKLGFFGVQPDSRRGAVALLRMGGAILEQPDAVLWITPQGRFADPRERPLELRAGLARLARRVGSCTLLPLAVEYPYWEERLPEALLRFGEPIRPSENIEDLEDLIRQRLEDAQDALAAHAMERDDSAFEIILQSREKVAFFYDLWRRLRAGIRGEKARLGHGKATK